MRGINKLEQLATNQQSTKTEKFLCSVGTQVESYLMKISENWKTLTLKEIQRYPLVILGHDIRSELMFLYLYKILLEMYLIIIRDNFKNSTLFFKLWRTTIQSLLLEFQTTPDLSIYIFESLL